MYDRQHHSREIPVANQRFVNPINDNPPWRWDRSIASTASQKDKIRSAHRDSNQVLVALGVRSKCGCELSDVSLETTMPTLIGVDERNSISMRIVRRLSRVRKYEEQKCTQ